MKKDTIGMVVMVLVIIGGINWGLVGAFDFNLVDTLLGEMSTLARIVYVVVGLSAVYMAVTAFNGKRS